MSRLLADYNSKIIGFPVKNSSKTTSKISIMGAARIKEQYCI